MTERFSVLVVDDDRRMVKTICDILKVKGFHALAAYTGEEALEQVTSARPDCVLMDVKMPGIDGVEALRLMRELSPELPVVLMSAYATEEQVAAAKAGGAYTVLSKPIDIQMVLSFLALLRKEESILIVDDDPKFCKTLKDILETRHYRVATESDADKVMSHMEQGYKLVVLLDLKLGDKNGLEVLKQIRARYPTKPVILVTGHGDEMSDSIAKGLQIGAHACLYKPLETEALLESIAEIGLKKMQAALGEPY